MRKVITTTFVSLDGVMQAPGGEPGFAHSGWVGPHFSQDVGKYKLDEVFEFDDLLLGRVTYQSFAGAWPQRDDPDGFARRMNAMTKHVATKSLTQLEWNNSHILQGDTVDAVARLRNSPGGNIMVAGSHSLVQTLIKHSLVDEFRLLVFPIVLGSGFRLFDSGAHVPLRLIETRAFSSGAVAMHYAPAGA